jgi:hypothetical protein
VPTTPLFDMSIHRVNHFTATLRKPWQRIFNLGHGARFSEIEPKRSDEVDFSGLGEVAVEEKNALEDFFRAHTSFDMAPEEKEAMQARKKECADKSRQIENFASSRYPGLDAFNEGFNEIASRLIHKEHPNASELSQIMLIYLENVGGYIGDFLNTREIDNPKRHVKKLQKIVAEQFEKIVKVYCRALEESGR